MYCRFDDRFDSDRDAFRLSLEACGMLLRAHTYISAHQTDGWVEEPFLILHARGRKAKRAIEELVERGWWKREGTRFFSVAYLQDNLSKAEIEQAKKADRERQERSRRRRAQAALPWSDDQAEAPA